MLPRVVCGKMDIVGAWGLVFLAGEVVFSKAEIIEDLPTFVWPNE